MASRPAKILCTFPGRYGDLLWALPTVRAIAAATGGPVDLQIAGEFASIVPLLKQQAYLTEVIADERWSLTPPDEWRAPELSREKLVWTGYTAKYNLGYRGWPDAPLPLAIAQTAVREYGITGLVAGATDLSRPWITVKGPGLPLDVAVGFTEAWFELKLGLLCSLEKQLPNLHLCQLTPRGSRWTTEVPPGAVGVDAADWIDAAQTIRNADLFLGDCSALHVLAVALGKPVVILEPMDARWNPIFYPLGMDGPEVTIVRGGDGRPTFDARHCADTLKAALWEASRAR